MNDGPWNVTVTWGDSTTSTFTTPTQSSLSAAHAYGVAGTFTAVVTVTDKYGASGSASTVLTVTAPALTGTFANGGSTNEGNTATVSFSNVAGGTGPYTYSYDFNDDGTFEVARQRSGNGYGSGPRLNPGSDTVHGRVTDSTGAFADFTTNITVNNLPPVVTAGGPSQTAVQNVSTNFGLGLVCGPRRERRPMVDDRQMGRHDHIDLQHHRAGCNGRGPCVRDRRHIHRDRFRHGQIRGRRFGVLYCDRRRSAVGDILERWSGQ